MAEEETKMTSLDVCLEKQYEIVLEMQEGGKDPKEAIEILKTLHHLKTEEDKINVDWNKSVLQSEVRDKELEHESAKLQFEEKKFDKQTELELTKHENEMELEERKLEAKCNDDKTKCDIEHEKLEIERIKTEIEKKQQDQKKKETRNSLVIGGAGVLGSLFLGIMELKAHDLWVHDVFEYEEGRYFSASSSKNIVSRAISEVFKGVFKK